MLAYVFVLLAFASRFVPHPWQFTPVAASLLFFGAYASRRQLWVPVALLAASDIILTKFVWAYPFSWDQAVSWLWYAAIVLLGTRLREDPKAKTETRGWSGRPLWIVAAALTSSVAFFLISNFAVWAAQNMYPKTLSGLMTSYAAGLPFFQREAFGDLAFTAAMFVTPVLLRLPSMSKSSPPTAV